MRHGSTAFFLAGVLLLGGADAGAAGASAQLKEGNRLFRKGRYEQALKQYEDGLIDAPYSSILHFNAGGAAYMAGDPLRAEKQFSEAAQSGNPRLQAAAHYNRGNALFRQGKWAEAAEAYKQSLRIHPADEDARYNLGVALKAKQKPPATGQPVRQSASPSGGKEDQQKGGDKKQDGKTSEQAAAPTKPSMSREDAERLLSAAGAAEKKKSQRAPKAGIPPPDVDW